jgi:4-diphosphocytidyl-2-C-methyl-D-erythritol kinase
MKALFDIAAPAKLNLFLHIVGRKPDGYHLLQSVFMLIDWHDSLHFELRNDGVISREDLLTPLPANDLIVRAAHALQQFSGCSLGAHIGIEKRIPAQAGMGGGSSDAASTLLALNQLWRLGLSCHQLQTIGIQLGADVPFFLLGQNAWVEGIGERMTPIEIPASQFVVLKPMQGLETQRIFSHPDLKRDTKPATILDFAADPFGFGLNDLQAVAQALNPGVLQAIEWLGTQGLKARMTGSGSAVFARVMHNANLKNIPDSFQANICNSLLAHPLQGWCS